MDEFERNYGKEPQVMTLKATSSLNSMAQTLNRSHSATKGGKSAKKLKEQVSELKEKVELMQLENL